VRAFKAAGDKLVVQCVALEQRKVNEESGLGHEHVAHVVDAVRAGTCRAQMFSSVKHLCALLLE
jgi:hypothetical protein